MKKYSSLKYDFIVNCLQKQLTQDNPRRGMKSAEGAYQCVRVLTVCGAAFAGNVWLHPPLQRATEHVKSACWRAGGRASKPPRQHADAMPR